MNERFKFLAQIDWMQSSIERLIDEGMTLDRNYSLIFFSKKKQKVYENFPIAYVLNKK